MPATETDEEGDTKQVMSNQQDCNDISLETKTHHLSSPWFEKRKIQVMPSADLIFRLF